MPGKQTILQTNQKTWDKVAYKYYTKATALPYWGPYHICKKKNLLGNVKGKTLLEVGSGSGLSIKYLMQKGAKKIFAFDISPEQNKIASSENKKHIENGSVVLFQSPMEKKITLPEKVDIVYSIYAIGWTVDPIKTLKNIYSYLKEGGLFVWSWEHPDFNRTAFGDGKVAYQYSYFDKESYKIKRWKDSGGVYLYPRTVSYWFKSLKEAGFEVIDFLEPEPEKFSKENKDIKASNGYYYYKKALTVPCTMIFICKKM